MWALVAVLHYFRVMGLLVGTAQEGTARQMAQERVLKPVAAELVEVDLPRQRLCQTRIP